MRAEREIFSRKRLQRGKSFPISTAQGGDRLAPIPSARQAKEREMAATYMLRKHLAACETAQRPENQRRAARDIEAARRAREDCRAAFPKVASGDDVDAATAYLHERIAHWQAALPHDPL